MLAVRTCIGSQATPFLFDLARLRIAVFRDWPYLYDGDLDYERNYLGTYARSPESLFVLALDGERVIGASTGIPLTDETGAFQKPFVEKGISPADVFYFGESVLLHEYRGHGLGHRFFDERESYARRLGRFAITAFCAVERAQDDPRRPAAHRSNEEFWTKRGYVKQPDMACQIEWKEIGESAPSPKRLGLWLRDLEPQER